MWPDGDLTKVNTLDGQTPQTGVGRVAELRLEGRLVEGLHRLRIEVEVLGHRLDAEPGPAELHRVGGQAMGDPLIGIGEFQLLDADAPALVAPDLPMFDTEHDLEIA